MPDLDLTGRRFGDYEILEMLGSGGMGKVYRALDVTLERVVALKMLAPNLSSDSAFVQRFVKEARAAARLNHPNIVQIYNFGTVESTYFLAMEYVKGHSLGYYLKHGHVFSESDGLQIVRQVGRALAVAHAEGLVHRDIKPDNLMLTSRGEVKIVDLGIAKRIDEDQSLTQSGTSIGTPHYISPEQIRGQKDIDARADIYSLGATLYHLVTGHTPFSGTSGPLVMSMHLVDPLPDPRKWVPDLSEGLCRVLRKMMAKKREERYPEMAFLDVDLHGRPGDRSDAAARDLRRRAPCEDRGEPVPIDRSDGADHREKDGEDLPVARSPLRGAGGPSFPRPGAGLLPLEVPHLRPDAASCGQAPHRLLPGAVRARVRAFPAAARGSEAAFAGRAGPVQRSSARGARDGARPADRAAREGPREEGVPKRPDALRPRPEAGRADP
jgi:serine/threonine protein kinase